MHTNMKLRKLNLAERVIALIDAARQKVACAANLAQVYTNYEIGRQIVEEEQAGRRRADYGKKIIEGLSSRLTAHYGRGWGVRNLETMRKFYLVYSDMIPQTASAELDANANSETAFAKSSRTKRVRRLSISAAFPISRFLGRITCSCSESTIPPNEISTSEKPHGGTGHFAS